MKKQFVSFLFCLAFLVGKGQTSILAEEATNYMGKIVTVCGKVSSARYLEGTASKPTLINIGGDYPNHALTILIKNDSRRNFSFKPEQQYLDKNICVTGKVIDYKGKPEIEVVNPSEILLKNEDGITKRRVEIKDKVTATNKNNTPGAQIKSPRRDSLIRPAPTASVLPRPETSSYTIEVTADINLREGPSTEDKVVAVIKAGSSVNIYKSGNGWSYVSVITGDDALASLYGFVKNSVLK